MDRLTLQRYLPNLQLHDFVTTSPLQGVLAAGAVVIALVGVSKALTPQKYPLPLPPGPPKKWFFEPPFPGRVAHTLADWTEEYGEVFTIRQGNGLFVVVGRMEAAYEILEKQGGSTVDRPRSVVAGELMSTGQRLILESGGERFRRLRRAAHTHLQPKAAQNYEPIQVATAREVIFNIMRKPEQFMNHIRLYAASVILRVTYGKRTPTSADSPEFLRVQHLTRNFQAAVTPGKWLVELMPFLKVFHRLGGMKNICDTLDAWGLSAVSRVIGAFGANHHAWRQYERDLMMGQVDRVRDEMKGGVAGPSFTRYLLENKDELGMTDEEIFYLAGALFGAGSDTTAVALQHAVMAAACFPEEAAKVQAELGNVIGKDRAPSFEDHDNLVQLQAFILEVLRWRPVTPIGFAHKANKDVFYKNYCIPKGAIVLGTHWAISRDPVAFPQPDAFLPSRWLDYSSGKPTLRSDMRYFTYGFGRRVCPGQHVANRSLYINLALMFWAFDISAPKEGEGKKLNPDSWTDAIASHLEPFEVRFNLRMEEDKIRRCLEELGGTDVGED